MNPLLVKERQGASFEAVTLTHELYGREYTERYNRLRQRVAGEAVFNKDLINMDRATLLRNSLAMGAARQHLIEKEGLPMDVHDPEFQMVENALAINTEMDLHYVMFFPALFGHMDEEQQRYWVPLAEKCAILGCYMQTELGHGSNVRALETTATFMPDTDEFELHSPTITSTKFWPGAMGLTATHGIVMARLIIQGKDYGVHPFMGQIRDTKTFDFVPGVEAGDIGPKIGYNQTANGWLRFNRVRIPRRWMCMKNYRVSRDGTYTKKAANDKLSYGTLVQTRSWVIRRSAQLLSAATTVGVRYSAVRVQGGDNPKKGTSERAVLDWASQQYRILPKIATSLALQFTFDEFNQGLYADFKELLEKGDLSLLSEVHVCMSALKSTSTKMTADAVEEMRRALGGHGFLLNAGVASMFTNYVGSCTVEGENYLLTQQVARFLLKLFQPGKKAVFGHSVAYLQRYKQDLALADREKCTAASAADMRCVNVIRAAFEHRAARLVLDVGKQLQREMASGCGFMDAWANCLVDIARLSFAHTFVIYVSSFAARVPQVQDESLRRVLHTQFLLFSLFWMEQTMGEFLEDGYLSGQQAGWVRSEVRKLLRETRPDAVALVDGFNISDRQLGSTLGRYDGNVYEALMDQARSSPLNDDKFVKGNFHLHLKQFLSRGWNDDTGSKL